ERANEGQVRTRILTHDLADLVEDETDQRLEHELHPADRRLGTQVAPYEQRRADQQHDDEPRKHERRADVQRSDTKIDDLVRRQIHPERSLPSCTARFTSGRATANPASAPTSGHGPSRASTRKPVATTAKRSTKLPRNQAQGRPARVARRTVAHSPT